MKSIDDEKTQSYIQKHLKGPGNNNVIKMRGTTSANKFIKELSEKDIDYLVICYREKGSSKDVQAGWSNGRSSELVHAACFIYELIKQHVYRRRLE